MSEDDLLRDMPFKADRSAMTVNHGHTYVSLYGNHGNTILNVTSQVTYKKNDPTNHSQKNRVEIRDGCTNIDIELNGKDFITPEILRQWADRLEEMNRMVRENTG